MFISEGGMALWKKLAIFGAIPSVGVLTLKTILDVQHQGHDEKPEFIAYDHLRIRNKVAYNLLVYLAISHFTCKFGFLYTEISMGRRTKITFSQSSRESIANGLRRSLNNTFNG